MSHLPLKLFEDMVHFTHLFILYNAYLHMLQMVTRKHLCNENTCIK